jgi:hypothetical protein
MSTSRDLFRRLPFWIVTSLLVSVLALVVVGFTEDETQPYDEGLVATIAWCAFVAAGLAFLLLCVVAGVQLMRRNALERH